MTLLPATWRPRVRPRGHVERGRHYGRELVRLLDLPADGRVLLLDSARHRQATASLDQLARATASVPPGSSLTVVAENPRGLGRALAAGPGQVPDNPVELRPLLSALADQGFTVRRLMLPYPDRLSPRWVVDTRLFDQPDGLQLIASLVVDAVPPPPPGTLVTTNSRTAFLAALREGSAVDLADSWVIVAQHGEGDSGPSSGDALMQVAAPAAWKEHWRVDRRLSRAGSAWQIGPEVAVDTRSSGPFVLDTESAEIPIGELAEDLLAATMLRDRATGEETRRVLGDWSLASRKAIANAPNGRRPLDLSPNRFVVAESGEWLPLPQDILSLIGLPFEALAFGALARTIPRLVGRIGLPTGLEGTLSVAEAARQMLRAIDVTCGDEHVHLWHEIDAALGSTIERDHRGLEARRRAVTEASARPLWAFVFDLPLDRLSPLIADGGLAELGGRVGEKMLADKVAWVGSRASWPAGMRQSVPHDGSLVEATRDERDLRVALEERSDALELQRAALAWMNGRSATIGRSSAVARRSRRPAATDRARYRGVRAARPFDARWYLVRYPDIAAAAMDPAFHWVRFGAAEGRDPGPAFRTKAYVLSLRDALTPGENPLVHFLGTGEGGAGSGEGLDATAADAAPPPATAAAPVPGLKAVGLAIDRIVGKLSSDEEYIAAVRQDEPWLVTHRKSSAGNWASSRVAVRSVPLPTAVRP